jgi:hypothetical protein
VINFYCDESIRENGGFIVGAYVYSECDLTPIIRAAIRGEGFDPVATEYKSSAKMAGNEQNIRLRAAVGAVVFEHCKCGFVVIPTDRRDSLGSEIFKALAITVESCRISGRFNVFFDNELTVDRELMRIHADRFVCHLGQDSVECAGVQAADYCAHLMGTMLLEEMGLFRKSVAVDEDSGYPAGLAIEIGFELWARLRHSFFLGHKSDQHDQENDLIESASFEMIGFGLHLSELCPRKLLEAAQRRFGKVYLGCIH